MTPETLKIAGRIDQCRQMLRGLFGDRYERVVRPYREALAESAVGVGTLEALIVLLERAEKAPNSSMMKICLCAAAADLLASKEAAS